MCHFQMDQALDKYKTSHLHLHIMPPRMWFHPKDTHFRNKENRRAARGETARFHRSQGCGCNFWRVWGVVGVIFEEMRMERN